MFPAEFEPPPPLPTSLDDVPSLKQTLPTIPEPPTDSWAQDTHSAWGPSTTTFNDDEEFVDGEIGSDDEWSKAVKERARQDALVVSE
jgi:hypothetical protein